jgi:hypothetical protein
MKASELETLMLASKAFGLMPPRDQERVLAQFARLRYPSVIDRFHESVYRVISSKDEVTA